ncbi:MAG: 2OG-Fe(II) oxygenase, partial [Acidobacteria bacterium]|nr:2OG-Fe(II) oxygenase [Acidobacteriota bacterium]
MVTAPIAHAAFDTYDWPAAHAELDQQGWATLPVLLDRETCDEVASWYDTSARFRSRVVMARHGFGQGEYQYFAYPLPPLVATLRDALYPRLVPVARAWNARLGLETAYPATLAEYTAACHAAGQLRPTPLLL